MLKKCHSLFAFHLQAARHSLYLFFSQPLATFMTVFVIAVTLALPTLFWVFTDNLSQLTSNWKQMGKISLYLKMDLQKAEQEQVLEKVRAIQGVGQASLKSAAEGLSELSKQEGMQDIMRYLPENPLPAVIEVVPALNTDNFAKLNFLLKNLEALPQVAQAKLDLAWIQRVHGLLNFAEKVTQALIFLLALAVILLIGNTLRLSIYSRREEIQILKLIGATDSFILRPFLYSGIYYGMAGALFAILLVHVFLLSIGLAVHRLVVVYEIHYEITGISISQLFVLLVFSVILGWLGAWLSVKRQLSFIEPHK